MCIYNIEIFHNLTTFLLLSLIFPSLLSFVVEILAYSYISFQFSFIYYINFPHHCNALSELKLFALHRHTYMIYVYIYIEMSTPIERMEEI